MKKSVRILGRTIIVITLALAVALVLCLDGVDYEPYLRTTYHTETNARMHAASRSNELLFGELAAGFGSVLLTPTINAPQDDPAQGQFRKMPLAGYGGRKGRSATGTHDDLHIKAVALSVENRVGVMVGADALIIPAPVADLVARRLEQELGLSREQVYLSATHTHCSLGGWGKGMAEESFAGPFHPGARTWFADRIVAAVHAAMADLRPATFGHGRFAAPEFVRNRLVGEAGRVDSEFSYALFQQSGGRLAVLGSFSAHATVLPSATMEFSADYPGCWQRAVEKATGGVAMFLAGGVGSHGPVAGAKGFAGAERMGQSLAQLMLERLPQTERTNRIAFGELGLEISLPPPNVRITDGLRLRPWLAHRLLPVAERSFLQTFRLDNSIWISAPCDFSGELALGIKEALRARGFSAIVTSFNGDYIGYVIPARYFHLNSYESRTMSFYGPNVPDYFDEHIRRLAFALIKTNTP